MPALRDLQARACRAFTGAEPDALDAALVSSRLPAAVGLAVYRNNFRGTVVKTLAASYPVVGRLVGDDCFATLARDYARTFPSRDGNLTRFGAHFPELLTSRYGGTGYAWLADVARLEWACQVVLSAPDVRSTDLTWLATAADTDLEHLHVHLHPATRLVRSDAPVLTIWRANQTAEVPLVDLCGGPEHVLVARVAGDVTLQPLAAADWQFLAALASGAGLGAAIASAAARATGCGAANAPELTPTFDPAGTLRWLAVRGLVVDAVAGRGSADEPSVQRQTLE